MTKNALYNKHVPHSPFFEGKENVLSRILRFLNVSWLLVETHKNCSCSYCKEKVKFPIEIRLPEDKSRNSWRVFFLYFWRIKVYVRWSLIE